MVLVSLGGSETGSLGCAFAGVKVETLLCSAMKLNVQRYMSCAELLISHQCLREVIWDPSCAQGITSLPDHLVFQALEKAGLQDFPDVLDMGPHVEGWQTEDLTGLNKHVYLLRSIIVYLGTGDSGHYIAYISKDGIWYLFNDKIVRKASLAEVLKQNAYMLFYDGLAKVPLSQVGTLCDWPWGLSCVGWVQGRQNHQQEVGIRIPCTVAENMRMSQPTPTFHLSWSCRGGSCETIFNSFRCPKW